MDAQSVKWGSRHGDNGYDGNKKVKGVKRNIITDRNGFILARKVCNAGIHDSRMAHDLCGLADDVWEDLRKVLSDRGYRGDVDKDIEKDFGIELEVSNTPNGVKGFLPKPLRWVVERTFAWLDSCRRLARNYEILNESAEEMIDFAAIKFLINKI
uniref:Transposase n=1 Tax=uncultured murine large bowel bacterium BAC 54B TaxID=314101 RepID=Q58WR5_9BACT|nr:transposase [uncultured murine large bowel bacterium BAC 54B]